MQHTRRWVVALKKFFWKDQRRNVVDEEEAPELVPEPEEEEEEEEEAREAPVGIRRGLEHAFDSAGEELEN